MSHSKITFGLLALAAALSVSAPARAYEFSEPEAQNYHLDLPVTAKSFWCKDTVGNGFSTVILHVKKSIVDLHDFKFEAEGSCKTIVRDLILDGQKQRTLSIEVSASTMTYQDDVSVGKHASPACYRERINQADLTISNVDAKPLGLIGMIFMGGHVVKLGQTAGACGK